MRKLFGIAALAAVIALLVAGIATVTGFSVAQTQAKDSFTVIEHADSDTLADLGDEGDSIGDTLSFSNELYDDTDSNVVGSSDGSCTRTKPGKTWHCTWTNTLQDGSIVVSGPFYDSGDSTLAITGGTGDYAGASGEMDLKARDGGAKYEFTFSIS